MKKILSMIVAVAVSGAVFATNPDRASGTNAIVTNNGANVKLFYKSNTPSKVVVSIFDANHKLVFSETLRDVEGFARPYNFSDLSEGAYSIEVNDGASRFSKQVIYKKDTRTQSDAVARLAKVNGENGKYILSIPKGAHKAVTVKIYNDGDRLTYTAKEELNGDFAKVYNTKSFGSKVSFELLDAEGKVISVLY